MLKVTQFRVSALARLGPTRSLVAPRALAYPINTALSGAGSALMTFWVNRTGENVPLLRYGPKDQGGGFDVNDPSSLGGLQANLYRSDGGYIPLGSGTQKVAGKGWSHVAIFLDAPNKRGVVYLNGVKTGAVASWTEPTNPFPSTGLPIVVTAGSSTSICHVAIWKNPSQATADAISAQLGAGANPMGVTPAPAFYAPIQHQDGRIVATDLVSQQEPADQPNAGGVQSLAWGQVIPPNVQAHAASGGSASSPVVLSGAASATAVTSGGQAAGHAVAATGAIRVGASALAASVPPNVFRASAQTGIALRPSSAPDLGSQTLLCFATADAIAAFYAGSSGPIRNISAGEIVTSQPYPCFFRDRVGLLGVTAYADPGLASGFLFLVPISGYYAARDLVVTAWWSWSDLTPAVKSVTWRADVASADPKGYPSFDPASTWTGTSDPQLPPQSTDTLASTDIVLHAAARPAGCQVVADKLLWVRLSIQAQVDPASAGQHHGSATLYATALFNR
jgi:hypothetical protein